MYYLKNAGMAAVLVLVLGSCRSMGPKTIPADGFNYNARIALQQNEQILLNIVRLRYGEVPHFLNVSSVINQYSRDARVGAGVNDITQTPDIGTDLSGGWSDRPTITYTPMSGQAFSQSLLTPLIPASVFFLIQSGWSVDRLFRLTVSSINGLQNEISGYQNRRSADAGFFRLLDLMRQLQKSGVLGVQTNKDEEDLELAIIFPEEIADDSVRTTVDEFKQLLNLDLTLNNFPIQYGMVQNSGEEIVIQTNSMVEILFNVSWYMDVPQEHITEGRTLSSFRSGEPSLIRITHSRNRPEAGFAAIKTRNYWYYIDDRDLNSKTTFAIIQILLSLANDGGQAVGPLISIGN